MAEHENPIFGSQSSSPEPARDPVRVLAEILQNTKLTPNQKNGLIEISRERFAHRRYMAYVALWSVVVSLGALFVASLVFDAGERLAPVSTLINWIEGFLTAIVAAYYGVSTWRPAS